MEYVLWQQQLESYIAEDIEKVCIRICTSTNMNHLQAHLEVQIENIEVVCITGYVCGTMDSITTCTI